MVTVSHTSEHGAVLHMPAPLAAVRHSLPTVFESMIAPGAVFYLVLLVAGFRGALIAAFAWSSAALVRRVVRRERIPTVLAVGLVLLALRTAVAFVMGSPTFYFVPTLASSAVVSLVLIGSAVVRKPVTLRFAEDFCPWHPEVLKRPGIQRFFVRVSLLWGVVLLTNSGLVLWLLLSASLKAFVVERTVISWGLSGAALAASVVGFTTMMRRDGLAVRWGRPRPAPALLPAERG